MQKQKEPEKGHYSAKRTRWGNYLVGKRKGKSRIRVVKDLMATANVHKGQHVKKKFVSSEKFALGKIEHNAEK